MSRNGNARLRRMVKAGKRKGAPHTDPIRDHLRSLPIDQRAEFIADVFRIIASEFAAMVLDHVEAPPAKDRTH